MPTTSRVPSFKEADVIEKIVFGVLNPNEVRMLAKVTVVRGELYEADGTPVTGGLRDPHFGAIEPGERCPVCGNTREMCPGHFGKIELPKPVFIPHYTDYLYKLLQATCRVCGRITLPEEKIRRYREIYRRLRAKWPQLAKVFSERVIAEAAQATSCPHCGNPQYKIIYVKPFHFYERRGSEGDVRLSPEDVLERVSRTQSEIEILGFHPERARPEWMITRVLIVPPLSVRPSITLETGLRSEDDLTHALAEIVRQAEKLRNIMVTNAPQTMIEDNAYVLQELVAGYIDNELPGARRLTHRRKRLLKTLAQRLKGKEGRLRGNLSGKRVNFSARTVISPDPNISINEVGVPVEIAKTLVVPMKVTPYNIEEARRYVINGPDRWPGAVYVYKASEGRKYNLKYANREELAKSLQPGDVVERHLINGDIVLFNRQPSLHRMSIMGHIVRVMPGKTFRLNLLVCPPYNADFDGDEMNLHVPQLEEAMAEARELMLVEKHILTPRYGGPIIGGRQDYVSGGYILTVKTSFYTRDEVSQILAATGYDGELPEPAVLKPGPYWTGKQIASLFFPDDLIFKGKSKTNAGDLSCPDEFCFHDSYIVVRHGRLLEGVLDKKAIGAEEPGNILHMIALEYGSDAARRLLDSLYRAFIRILELRGLTMSIHDIDLPEKARRQVEDLIVKYKERVYELYRQYEEGRLEPIPGRTLEETLEIRIMDTLDELRKEVQSIAANYLDPYNDVFIMARTGARGSEVNISQMAAMLGQQSVRGKRITRGFRNRPLPHFKPNDIEPEAWGFIKGSFREGLSPAEVFFHAAAGREGLVDTAVKTSQSGYMQRRLINALQDLFVYYDGTVRDSWGNVVQFKYGEDGVDPMRTYHGKAVDVDRLIERARALRAKSGKTA